MKRVSDIDFGRVGVLMGGLSPERIISFKSGKAVYEALKSANIDVVSIILDTENPEDIAEILDANKIDVGFIAMHGRFGEDGALQEILEHLDVPYTCSGIRASRLSMDKIISRNIFKENGLCVPNYTALNRNSEYALTDLLKNFDFPVVVKPASAGSSIGLSIVDDKDRLKNALGFAFRHDKNVIVEEYIKGREFTVGVLDEQPLPIVEIIPKTRFFDYEAKYTPGFTEYIVPAELDAELNNKISEAALLAHKSLDCFGCSRVDLILNDEDLNPYILEVNSIPGFTSTSLLPKAAKQKNIEFPELCLMLVKSAVKRYNMLKSSIRFHNITEKHETENDILIKAAYKDETEKAG